MRLRPWPKSINSRLVSSVFASSCGVKVPRTSLRLAKAVMIRLTGEVTLRVSPSQLESPFGKVHCVRIDKLSLPTGIEMSSAGHSSMPTALTVS